MKKIFALICAVILLFGYALCEEELPQEIIEESVEITEEEEEILQEVVEVKEPEPEPEIIEPEEKIIEEEEELPVEEQEPFEEKEEIIEEKKEEVTEEEEEEEEKEEEIVEEKQEEVIEEEEKEEEVEEQEEIVEEQEEEKSIDELFPDRKLVIEITKKPEYLGDTVIFTLKLVNYPEGELLNVEWQYSEDNENWQVISEANELSYEFIVTRENCKYWYRGAITYKIKEE